MPMETTLRSMLRGGVIRVCPATRVQDPEFLVVSDRPAELAGCKIRLIVNEPVRGPEDAPVDPAGGTALHLIASFIVGPGEALGEPVAPAVLAELDPGAEIPRRLDRPVRGPGR